MTHELYKTKEDIENWLNAYNVKKYELIEDKKYGYVVNVNKSVYLNHIKIKYIKVKFNIINGEFYCPYSSLENLIGCPKIINGFFDVSNNKLTTLEGCPEIITETFNCSSNNIDALKYFPKNIGGICHLSNNIKLKEIQKIKNFEELYLMHKKELNTLLNKY